MSLVYLAADEQLQREVVIKVLSPALFDEARVERFRQEVLQTARLQHPTIIPVLDVGAFEDALHRLVPYYVMPYARGESLRSRLHHEGQLSISVTMRVMRSVFDALAYSHAHGVVHRDIKPENIFLSGTNALVADFGIAKAIAGPGSREDVTAPGTAVGTPSYMAPEQLVDADRVGPRADLFAAGVVAFEMLTGRLPWSATSPIEALASQVQDRIVPLRSLRADVPIAMASVIESCLAWDANRRPESAAAALQALEAVPVLATPDTTEELARSMTAERARRRGRFPRRRIAAVALLFIAAALVWRVYSPPRDADVYRKFAVAYPEVPADSPARDELAERLYHMLTTAMAPVSGLRLVGLVSVPRWVELGLSLPQIVDSLRLEGVDSVLVLRATRSTNGAILKAIELQDATMSSGQTVAGPVALGDLDRLSPDSMSVVVRQLAAQVIAKLHLSSANRTVSETQMIDAYMAWLSGRDAAAKRTPLGIREAVEFLERAIMLDPEYAQAHADLAQTLALSLFYHYKLERAPYAVASRALQMADRAVTLQPQFADGYLARGLVGTIAGAPLERISADFEDVARLQSDNPYRQTWRLGLIAKRGQFADAVQGAEEELSLDPHSAGQRVASALYALPAGQYATAIRIATAARAERVGVPMVAQLELWGRLRLGGENLAECTTVPAGPYLGARALCLEGAGREREALDARDRLFAMLTGTAAIDSTFDLALSLGEMAAYTSKHGDEEATRRWLREAFADSPAGVDYRLMRSGMFTPAMIAFSDSLGQAAWSRVRPRG